MVNRYERWQGHSGNYVSSSPCMANTQWPSLKEALEIQDVYRYQRDLDWGVPTSQSQSNQEDMATRY